MPGLDPSAMRRLNTSVVLRALAEHDEPVTMATLVAQVALSRRTVELILGRLCESGWAVEVTPVHVDVGRPPRFFAFEADRSLVVAVRIDTHAASAAVSDIRGRVLGRGLLTLHDYSDTGQTMLDAVEAVDAAIRESGMPRDRVRAGAVASGGAIDEDGVVHRLINAPAWNGFALADELGAHLGIPMFADNDANLAALAEHWRGAAQQTSTFAWCILGNRTGVGIVIKGDVHRGFRGAAGEIVEAGVLDASRMEYQPFGLLTSPLVAERREAAALVERARTGDAEALVLLDDFADDVARLLSSLAWTIAPEMIVLGGGLEVAGDVLLPRVTAALEALGALSIDVRATTIGSDAPLLGAVKLVLDRMDAEFFGPTVSTYEPGALNV
ncbi:Sugar kinase of the NBD/HSP70 family, may contain an N-terminal HTH domain [Agreia bicolorata]|uniref:Sugar kinase of the NBD/HSP70 family, may contain an N-terminal HTH domain n=1 Tax=Agreia bicolorata TaxID=110935 RepID=A0A1T4WRS5_9MICO|nr:ROK family protein [Agreia bicolorata]SKA80063.1 Sugar kinase of the NBD/HSP70 family, may contain an N-terminal HTH domain [Agreia bicolorata]